MMVIVAVVVTCEVNLNASVELPSGVSCQNVDTLIKVVPEGWLKTAAVSAAEVVKVVPLTITPESASKSIVFPIAETENEPATAAATVEVLSG